MACQYSRRNWLRMAGGGVAGAYLVGAPSLRAATAPATRVTVAKCKTYDSAELVATLDRMFDQLGGLGRIVKGKTVAMKINLTGASNLRLGHLPAEDTHYTHPHVIAATVHLMGRAGAKRIRVLESPWSTADPIEEVILQSNWEPRDILNAAANVEFENTNYLGQGKKYVRMMAANGGLMYPGFELNHSYADCDVFVSLAKMKEHATAGITLSMKNCFGLTPCTIYGSGAGVDEPATVPKGGRDMVHNGRRQPSKIALAEKDPHSPRDPGYRVPRTVVDLISARPIDLAVVEGVRSMAGGEGPWVRGALQAVSPGVMVAGTNPVNVDAVSMAVMGFDPMADRGKPPFEHSDSTLGLAENAGIGTRDLKRIEVVGVPVQEAMFNFAELRRQRAARG
jgi:uncharacterized protein (DUF362 family)